MLAIKFRRQGKKHQASFRLIVAEKRSKLRGRFIDDLGWLDPKAKKFDIKKEDILRWLKVGAKPTTSVHNLLVKTGIVEAPKISVHSKKKVKEGEEVKIEAEAKPEINAESKLEKEVAAETEVKSEVKTEIPKERSADMKTETK